MAAEADYSKDEDVRLMQQVAGGNERAFRQLVERWQGPLINFFYRSVSSVETAEDLAQATFVRLYRAASAYEPRAKFSTYLFHIGRRLMINEFRRQSRKPLDSVDPSELGGSVSGRQPLEVMEIEEAFEHALEKLPENQKTALLLLKQQELSYEQIAEIMGASVPAVKTWIHRGRAQLKAELGDLLKG